MVNLNLTILILLLLVCLTPYGIITYYLIKDVMKPIELVSLIPVTLLNILILWAIRELIKDCNILQGT